MNAVLRDCLTFDDKLEWVSESYPYLANSILSDERCLRALTGHSTVIAIQDDGPLILRDPTEYGIRVRRALIDTACDIAKEHCEHVAEANYFSLPDWRSFSLREVVL